MPMFKVSSRATGADYGDYPAADAEGAFRALARLSGYDSLDAAAAAGDVPPRDLMMACEVAPRAELLHAVMLAARTIDAVLDTLPPGYAGRAALHNAYTALVRAIGEDAMAGQGGH